MANKNRYEANFGDIVDSKNLHPEQECSVEDENVELFKMMKLYDDTNAPLNERIRASRWCWDSVDEILSSEQHAKLLVSHDLSRGMISSLELWLLAGMEAEAFEALRAEASAVGYNQRCVRIIAERMFG